MVAIEVEVEQHANKNNEARVYLFFIVRAT